jgi:hypothetical protein
MANNGLNMYLQQLSMYLQDWYGLWPFIIGLEM